MSINEDYTTVPMHDALYDDNGRCCSQAVKKGLVKGGIATGGAIGGAALGLIPTIVCIAITYLGLQLSGEHSLSPYDHQHVDMTKVTIGILLTVGGGISAIFTGLFCPIFGAVKGGKFGWDKAEEICLTPGL